MLMLPMPAIRIIAAAVTALIAITFLYYGVKLKQSFRLHLLEYDRQTQGTVARQWKKEVPLDGGEISTVWYVDYRFQTDEQEYELCSDVGHYKKMFEDGGPVTVYYKSDDPAQFYVMEENTHDKLTYRFVFVLGYIVIGLAVLLQILLAR